MLPDGALTITTQLIMDGVEVKLGDKLPYDRQNWGLGAARGGMPVKVPRVKFRTSLSIMALCAFSQGAGAATISITKEVFAGNAPLANPPSPALHSGNFLQRMTGSIHYLAISPYAFNTGPGPGGSAAATNAPDSVLNAGGGRLSSATYNVNSSSFTLLWGTPFVENQIAFYTGENGTGSLINVIGGDTTFYNGSNLPCYISGCRGRFDLVTFTVSNGKIGSVVLSDRGGGSFEYNIVSPAVVAELKASKASVDR